jgi:small-conductance mechanosensitive channel
MEIPAQWQVWLWSAALMLAAVALARVAHHVIFSAAKRFTTRTESTVDDSLVRHVERPSKTMLPLLVVVAMLPLAPLPPSVEGPLRHLVGLGLIASLAWLVIAAIDVIGDVIAARYDISTADNLMARRVRTQFQVLRRIAAVVVVLVALSIMLMTFPAIRHLGTSLLASAGLAGLVVGLAARSTLSSLIAGVQLALTQPIRIDDVVIVEGEWGWIEEIGTTYVVVRVWDLRRLVVPLSYFIEHPFQNWTRVSADILGTVFVHTDYTVPVEEVRQELRRITEASPLWDGRVCGLQVTNATERTVELRALVSAADSGKAWDLRCHVREKLIAFLQRNYPESLPRTRADINPPPRSERTPAWTPPGSGPQG